MDVLNCSIYLNEVNFVFSFFSDKVSDVDLKIYRSSDCRCPWLWSYAFIFYEAPRRFYDLFFVNDFWVVPVDVFCFFKIILHKLFLWTKTKFFLIRMTKFLRFWNYCGRARSKWELENKKNDRMCASSRKLKCLLHICIWGISYNSVARGARNGNVPTAGSFPPVDFLVSKSLYTELI